MDMEVEEESILGLIKERAAKEKKRLQEFRDRAEERKRKSVERWLKKLADDMGMTVDECSTFLRAREENMQKLYNKLKDELGRFPNSKEYEAAKKALKNEQRKTE